MLRVLLPVILLLLGTGGGVAGAMFLLPGDEGATPAPEHAVSLPDGIPPCGPEIAADGHAPAAAPADAPGSGHDTGAGREYFRIDNQFVIPVVGTDRVASLVVASLSLEITAGSQDQVYDLEPRIRDALLQALFDHANLGGFDGMFTSAANMRTLRTALLSEARRVLGPIVYDVLVTDLVREDADR